MKTETYLLPDFWANSLINGDNSGLESIDIEALNTWLNEHKPGYCLTCSSKESTFTAFHDARNFVLACNCLDYAFVSEQK